MELSSEPESPARPGRVMRTPALPDDFAARFDCPSRGKCSGNDIVRDEPNPQHQARAAASGARRNSLLSSAAGASSIARSPSSSLGVAPSPEAIAAPKTNVFGIVEGVFGGAFFPSPVPPIQGSPKKANGCSAAASRAAADGGEGGGGTDPDGPAATVAPVTIPAVRPPPPPPSERYFVAYGHCLLAAAGTGARDEATQAAAAAAGSCGGILSPSKIGDFGSISSRARVSAKNRTRGYGDALEVFQEGLRRFPTSTILLYGASLAMQART